MRSTPFLALAQLVLGASPILGAAFQPSVSVSKNVIAQVRQTVPHHLSFSLLTSSLDVPMVVGLDFK
jgi:hypothetical protein